MLANNAREDYFGEADSKDEGNADDLLVMDTKGESLFPVVWMLFASSIMENSEKRHKYMIRL